MKNVVKGLILDTKTIRGPVGLDLAMPHRDRTNDTFTHNGERTECVKVKNAKMRLVATTALLAMGACLSEAPELAEEDDQTSVQVSANILQCQINTMCFWGDNGFAGGFKALEESISNFEDINFGDRTTSVRNRTTVAWVLFRHDTFQGSMACVRPDASVANLGNFAFNDIVSSAQRQSGDVCPTGSIVFTGLN